MTGCRKSDEGKRQERLAVKGQGMRTMSDVTGQEGERLGPQVVVQKIGRNGTSTTAHATGRQETGIVPSGGVDVINADVVNSNKDRIG